MRVATTTRHVAEVVKFAARVDGDGTVKFAAPADDGPDTAVNLTNATVKFAARADGGDAIDQRRRPSMYAMRVPTTSRHVANVVKFAARVNSDATDKFATPGDDESATAVNSTTRRSGDAD